jgi:hypothetical protein
MAGTESVTDPLKIGTRVIVEFYLPRGRAGGVVIGLHARGNQDIYYLVKVGAKQFEIHPDHATPVDVNSLEGIMQWLEFSTAPTPWSG